MNNENVIKNSLFSKAHICKNPKYTTFTLGWNISCTSVEFSDLTSIDMSALVCNKKIFIFINFKANAGHRKWEKSFCSFFSKFSGLLFNF